jgi:hypothetical protein
MYTGPQALGSVVLRGMSPTIDGLSSKLPVSELLPLSTIAILPG